ncbi:hypothetical protein D3C84_1196350 [compost metagenome]
MRLIDGMIDVLISIEVAYTSYSLVPVVSVVRSLRKSWAALEKRLRSSLFGTK